jgi:hypothetical protein
MWSNFDEHIFKSGATTVLFFLYIELQGNVLKQICSTFATFAALKQDGSGGG